MKQDDRRARRLDCLGHEIQAPAAETMLTVSNVKAPLRGNGGEECRYTGRTSASRLIA